MDYAIQLLIPILGGLLLGHWLSQTFGLSPVWTVILAIVGMVAGLAIMYRRTMQASSITPPKSIKPRPSEPDTGKSVTDLSFLYEGFDEDADQPEDRAETQKGKPDQNPKPPL